MPPSPPHGYIMYASFSNLDRTLAARLVIAELFCVPSKSCQTCAESGVSSNSRFCLYFLEVPLAIFFHPWLHSSCSMAHQPVELSRKLVTKPTIRANATLCRNTVHVQVVNMNRIFVDFALAPFDMAAELFIS